MKRQIKGKEIHLALHHIKRSSTLVTVREIEIEVIVRSHPSFSQMIKSWKPHSAGTGTPCIISWNKTLCNSKEGNLAVFIKILNLDLDHIITILRISSINIVTHTEKQNSLKSGY